MGIQGYCPEHGERRYYGAIINGRKFCDAAGCQRMLLSEAGAHLQATLRRVVSGSGRPAIVEDQVGCGHVGLDRSV